MNVIQRPRAEEFCATMQDYIIDTDSTITFSVQYGGKTVLEEEYVPDANYQVRVRKLGKFCELALWGVWCAGEASWQTNAAGTFTFFINGLQDSQSYVMFSRLQTKKEASAPGWLSEVREKVTRNGAMEYASSVFTDGDKVLLNVRTLSGAVYPEQLYVHKGEKMPVTLDVSMERVGNILPDINEMIRSYELVKGSDVFKFLVDQTRYEEVQRFRYKNVYDMPETMTTVGGMTMKGNDESDMAKMFGVDRKFGVKPKDEYTVSSGVIFLQSDYKLWHNLLNAQEVDIWYEDSWFPIIVTKQNYERSFNRSILKAIEFTFKMADVEQNNLI